MKTTLQNLQALLSNPEGIKRAAAALVTGFVAGRRAFAGAEGLEKTAAAAPQLLGQAENVVRNDIALRLSLFGNPS